MKKEYSRFQIVIAMIIFFLITIGAPLMDDYFNIFPKTDDELINPIYMSIGFFIARLTYYGLIKTRQYEEKYSRNSEENIERGKAKHDHKIGDYKIFNNNDQILESGQYYYGEKVGEFKRYYRNGRLKEKGIYTYEAEYSQTALIILISIDITYLIFFNSFTYQYFKGFNNIVEVVMWFVIFIMSLYLTNMLIDIYQKRKLGVAYVGNSFGISYEYEYDNLLYYESGSIKSKIKYLGEYKIKKYDYTEQGDLEQKITYLDKSWKTINRVEKYYSNGKIKEIKYGVENI